MNPVELLQTMVEIQSLSGHEQPLAEYLVAQMRDAGFEAHIDEAGNAAGHLSTPGDNGRHLVMLGHMDTVPGDIPVRIEGDLLYGRGSVDAKGPLATFIAALAQTEPPPGLTVTVIGAVEEEAASSKGAQYAAQQYRPDACIIGEPSGWDGVTLGYKGRLLAQYTMRQPCGHSAGPEGTVAEAAILWWNAVTAFAQEFNASHKRLFDQLLPALLDFNTSSDGLQDEARLTAGFRLPPDFDSETFAARLAERAGNAQVHVEGREIAFESTRTTPLARAFNVALREVDERARFKLKTGTSDMNVVGPVWQCPIVAYGPGDSSLDHTPNEHISIDEYRKAIDVLSRVISKM